MKKAIFTVILIFISVFFSYGQNTSPIDLVLLLDTSSSMSSSYENVNNYITGAFLTEFLRLGDTFHLIAFSTNPRFDCARRILGIGDVETIIGRMLIQYPIEPAAGSNISTVLTYAERYISYLPVRPKKIVLITGGGSDTNNLVNASKQRLSSRNTTLDYIQVTPGRPLSNPPRSGRPAASITSRPTIETTSPVSGRPSTETSSQAGTDSTTGTSSTAGTGATAGTGTATGTGAATGTIAGTDAASTGAGTSTAAGTEGQVSTQDPNTAGLTQNTHSVTGGASEPDSSSTTTSSVSGRKTGRSISFASSFPFIILIIVLFLLILGLVIFFASRKLGSSPNRVMADAASGPRDETRFADHSKDLAKFAAVQGRRTTPYDDIPIKTDKYAKPVINPSGPLLLNLYVEDQNTFIGKRNIHSLKSGYSLSVGGGKSDDFLIFLVPIPARLGEIRRDGSALTFVPKKQNYFPDSGVRELKDCINKTIRVISNKNYEIRFRFEMYEDPIIALNRMLMSVKVPG
jgi:hypothetical protein